MYINKCGLNPGVPLKLPQNPVFPAICLKYRFFDMILGDLYTFSHRNIFISDDAIYN